MAVRFLIQARVEDGHVAGHLRVGKLDVNTSPSCAPPNVGVKLVPGSHVRKKVSVPIGAPVPGAIQRALLNHLGFGIKVYFVLDVGSLVRVAKDEIHIADARQRQRHVVVVQQPHRFIALHVTELVRVVMRHQE